MITNTVEDSDVILVVAASDVGACRRRGQKLGAKEIYELIKELDTNVRILDYGGLFLDNFNLKNVHEKIEKEIRELKNFNRPILLIGGDHSVSYGAAKAFEKAQIHSFDAHPDLVEDKMMNQQSFMREFKNRLSLHGVRYATAQERESMKHLKHTTEKEVYISIDVDILDPEIMPGVAYPVENGWDVEELKETVTNITRTKTIVCIDIVEFCPLVEREKSLETLKEMLCFLVEMFKKAD